MKVWDEGCDQTSPTPATNVRLWRRGPEGSEASANLRLRPTGEQSSPTFFASGEKRGPKGLEAGGSRAHFDTCIQALRASFFARGEKSRGGCRLRRQTSFGCLTGGSHNTTSCLQGRACPSGNFIRHSFTLHVFNAV